MSGGFLLSREIRDIGRSFRPYRKLGVTLQPEGVVALLDRLELAAQLSTSLEQELAVHRLVEAGRQRHQAIEEVAFEATERLALEQDGNVVRPDFGKKP